MSIYETETYDINCVIGDTVNIGFEFKDSDGDAVDITDWQIKFTVLDPITKTSITDLYKYHDFTANYNDGIYHLDDTNTRASLTVYLTTSNQIIIVLPFADTSDIEAGVYPYDVEIYKNDNTTKFTPVKGNLVFSEERTASV